MKFDSLNSISDCQKEQFSMVKKDATRGCWKGKNDEIDGVPNVKQQVLNFYTIWRVKFTQ